MNYDNRKNTTLFALLAATRRLPRESSSFYRRLLYTKSLRQQF